MTRRPTRTTVATGIYRDRFGFQAQVNGGRGKGNTARFARGTPLKTMKAWQRRRLSELAETPGSPKPETQRNRLRDAVPQLLAMIPKGTRRRTIEAELAPWLETALAETRRADITALDIKAQRARWLDAGYAASTVNHRVSGLRTLYRELDGEDAYNPARGLKKIPEPKPQPRGVTFALVEQILMEIRSRRGRKLSADQRAAAQAAARVKGANYSAIARRVGVSEAMIRKLAKGKTVSTRRDTTPYDARTWLRVLLYTGLPPAQANALGRQDIHWDVPSLWTTPRRKGAGTEGATLPLIPQAVDALRALDAGDLYGQLNMTQVRHFWNQARRAFAAKLKDDTLRTLVLTLRPYDLRHTFLTEAYRHSGDHRAVGELGLHADERTTRRYTLAAVSERAARAAQALAAATSAASAKGA